MHLAWQYLTWLNLSASIYLELIKFDPAWLLTVAFFYFGKSLHCYLREVSTRRHVKGIHEEIQRSQQRGDWTNFITKHICQLPVKRREKRHSPPYKNLNDFTFIFLQLFIEEGVMEMNANEQLCLFIILIQGDNPKFIWYGLRRAETHHGKAWIILAEEAGRPQHTPTPSPTSTPTPTQGLIFYWASWITQMSSCIFICNIQRDQSLSFNY